MTQEEKELLFKDLCSRLPYGVIVKYKSQGGEGDVELGCGNIGYVLQLGHGWWKECKPYLRSLSSMTEEEDVEYTAIGRNWPADIMRRIDWLNKHHFDYRGLIPLGLGIDCTGLNIYENEKSM